MWRAHLRGSTRMREKEHSPCVKERRPVEFAFGWNLFGDVKKGIQYDINMADLGLAFRPRGWPVATVATFEEGIHRLARGNRLSINAGLFVCPWQPFGEGGDTLARGNRLRRIFMCFLTSRPRRLG